MPDSNVPLVADMSSDILSRTFDAEPFALIYGGVQKNMGSRRSCDVRGGH